MIPIELLQKSIIAKLRANTALITYLGGTSQIKENQWQGQDFTYPAIRLDIQPQTPMGTGTDRTRLSNSMWMIRTYSQEKDSYQANHMITLVVNALFNKQIDGTDENNNPYFRLLRINILNIDGAFRITDRLWMATAIFESEGNLINPP